MRLLRSFASQTTEEPDIRGNVKRLFLKASPQEVYTLPQLADRLQVTRIEPLVQALADLTRDHIVDQIFRIESPKNRGGIEDFTKLEDIPDSISDWRQGGLEIDVTPQLVKVLFRKHNEERTGMR